MLFGAPNGAQARLDAARVAYPDAVLLFDLRAVAVEGLDTIRNRSWQAGRTAPLVLVGPDGTRALADGLDKAFEQSDALAYVDAPPAGDFGAARLAPVEVRHPRPVFDTGDLVVRAYPDSPTGLAYQVIYDRRVLHLAGCGVARWQMGESGAETDPPDAPCGLSGAASWPLAATPVRLNSDVRGDISGLGGN